jgi:hypothetical protein
MPSSWGTLYALTQLSDEQFAAGIADGTINPDMRRKDVARLQGKPDRPKSDSACGNPTPALAAMWAEATPEQRRSCLETGGLDQLMNELPEVLRRDMERRFIGQQVRLHHKGANSPIGIEVKTAILLVIQNALYAVLKDSGNDSPAYKDLRTANTMLSECSCDLWGVLNLPRQETSKKLVA